MAEQTNGGHCAPSRLGGPQGSNGIRNAKAISTTDISRLLLTFDLRQAIYIISLDSLPWKYIAYPSHVDGAALHTMVSSQATSTHIKSMSSDENERGLKASSKSDTTNPQKIIRDEEKQQDAGQSFLVEWDGDNDPLDPRTFSAARKCFYVAVVAVGSLLV